MRELGLSSFGRGDSEWERPAGTSAPAAAAQRCVLVALLILPAACAEESPAADADPDGWWKTCSRGTLAMGTHVHSKADLREVAGFTGTTAGLLIQCRKCTDLALLGCLTYVQGDLTISDNPLLENLAGLDKLNRVKGKLEITMNPALESLAGLESLHSAEQGFVVSDNAQLVTLQGLPRFQEIGGPATISRNPGLVDLRGLERVTSVAGTLSIHQNDGLQDLTGLDNVVSAGGLSISENRNLLGLAGLRNLASTRGLGVRGNQRLESLIGLPCAMDITYRIAFNDNPLLPDCTVCEFLSCSNVHDLEPHWLYPGFTVAHNLDDACTPVPESCPQQAWQ